MVGHVGLGFILLGRHPTQPERPETMNTTSHLVTRKIGNLFYIVRLDHALHGYAPGTGIAPFTTKRSANAAARTLATSTGERFEGFGE